MSLLVVSMASCDSGGSSSYTPSSTYSPPSTRTVNCSHCNGGGVVLNPYDGNYYYCQNCGGSGKVTVSTSGSNPSCGGSGKVTVSTSGSNPSFGGNKYKYDCERCLCPRYAPKSTFNSDCKNCDHPKGWHYSQQ